ncbi:hypothetical protein GDO81_026078 [Engystomops pustulosus]|uniref:Uncharacterized protein n=1 Tax=Engystomops pustulosus TaxID=76066 RepID=A0AAV6Z8K3_ENGPU|nr:hypothetical protein GDO81_026078 [Engystomops pustulosus]
MHLSAASVLLAIETSLVPMRFYYIPYGKANLLPTGTIVTHRYYYITYRNSINLTLPTYQYGTILTHWFFSSAIGLTYVTSTPA